VVDTAEAVVAADEVVVSSNTSFLNPPFHQLMGLTRTLVGGFTSSNAAPLGGHRRW
jgi:hypothetical protein